LNVNDASAQSLTTYLGAELSTTMGMPKDQSLMPTLRMAWAHNFDDPWKVHAFFNGVGPSSTFTVDASTWSRDSALVDLSLSMLFDEQFLGTLGYNANLGGTETNQAVYGRLDVKF
jgi:outer membrane autotransporter protein